MKITRLGKNRDISEPTNAIDIELGAKLFSGDTVTFRITEEFGKLKIHKSNGETININPCVSNVCLIS